MATLRDSSHAPVKSYARPASRRAKPTSPSRHAPPIGWDKGRAVLHVLRSRHGPAWTENVRVIYIGDDQTDEDAFRILAGMAATFRVGPADALSAASRRLHDVNAVTAILRWLAGRKRAR